MTNVFISSTSVDLTEYRKAAIEVCLRLGFLPIGMEYFGPMGVGATEGSKRKLDEADLYVGIFAHRYGYIEDGYDKSVTEIEFDYAGERQLERLCFIVHPQYEWPNTPQYRDDPSRVKIFQDRLSKDLIRIYFTSVDDFRVKLIQALDEWEDAHPKPAPPRRKFSPLLIGVLLLFLVLGVVGAAGAGWYLSQPSYMTGQFNVAVAAFKQVPENAPVAVADAVRQRLLGILDTEYQAGILGFDVQVTSDRIGVINNASEAKELAKNINAHVVIYGDVIVSSDGNTASLSPRFYVAERYRSEVGELVGLYQLNQPIDFTTQDISAGSSIFYIVLQQRTSVLIEFTKALAYLISNDLQRAHATIDNAIKTAETTDQKQGIEILYLFGSTIARLDNDLDGAQENAEKALEINPNYGRAVLAEGNVYYDRGRNDYAAGDVVTAQENFATALSYYSQALRLEDQPYGAHIVEKANLGFGNIYAIQYLIADPSQKADLAQKATAYYQVAIDSYKASPDEVLKTLAVIGYYWSGVIYDEQNDDAAAEKLFNEALALDPSTDFKADIDQRLKQIKGGGT